jgi:hypothetical protein
MAEIRKRSLIMLPLEKFLGKMGYLIAGTIFSMFAVIYHLFSEKLFFV